MRSIIHSNRSVAKLLQMYLSLTIALFISVAFGPRVVIASASDAPDATNELQEIVVSARKKEERLIDVPASVDVISSQMIEQQRIEDVDTLFGKVPSLYFSANFLSPGRDFVNLVIRGIGAQSAGVPAVGTYVDGVYTPSLGFDIGFLDLERVEVLEGPQGTLFGRNTEGGALNIVTRKPTQEFRGQFQSLYDSFNTFDEKISVAGGLTNDIAASFAMNYSHTDGFMKERGIQEELDAIAPHAVPAPPADDMRKVAARLAVRWLPKDTKTEVNLTVDLYDDQGHEPLPGVPICCFPGGLGSTFGGDPYGIYSSFQDVAHDTNHGAALTIDHDLGFAKFSSITGYRYLTNVSPFDFSGGIDYLGNFHDLRQQQDFASQEFRLAGEVVDQLSWVAGLYGFDEDDNQYRSYHLETTPQLTGIDIYYQNQLIKRVGYAFFGQASWTPIERWEFTAGLRYSWERARSRFADKYIIPNFFGPGQTLADGGTDGGQVHFGNVSPTGSVRYKFADTLSLYARYAKGFKPGGYPSAPDVGTDIPFRAETSDNYEVGFKGEFLERRLSANLAVYDIEIKNQQLQTIVFNSFDTPIASVGNAGKSRSRGIEINIDAHPMQGLTLNANAGFTDAKYIQYVDTSGKNRAGEDFPYVPRRTASAGFDYEMPAVHEWTPSIGSTYKYVGPILSGTGVDLDVQFPVPSYYQLDLRAGLAKDHWQFGAFVDNVTNQYIITRIWNTFFFPVPPGRPFAEVDPPRRYGVRATYSF